MHCPQCGRELSAPGAACLGCLVDSSAPPPAPPLQIAYPASAPPPPPPPPPPPLPPPPPPLGTPAPPPPAYSANGPADHGYQQAAPPVGVVTMQVPAPSGNRRTATVLAIAAVAVLVVAGGVVLLTRKGGDSESSTTNVTAPTSPSGSPSGSLADGTPTVVTTVPNSGVPSETFPLPTQPPVTAAPVTVGPTSPPVTVFDPAATPPVPAVTPIAGPGSPQVLSNPLPSGVSYDQVASSLWIAQQLGDALANDDWNTARRLEPAKSGNSNQKYLDGYDGLDRVSLLLVDARPDGAGYRLLVVSVANEKSGARTSLYCLEWTVDPGAVVVTQHGGVVGQIGRVPYAISPEGVRNDPSLDATVRTQCHWN